jgi:hypothetical protein
MRSHALFLRQAARGNSLKGVERTRGRFRSYLLGTVRHFLSDLADRALAEKRGSGQETLSLQASPGHDRYKRQENTPLDVADPHGFPQDVFFDRQLALTCLLPAVDVARSGFIDRSNRSDKTENASPQSRACNQDMFALHERRPQTG